MQEVLELENAGSFELEQQSPNDQKILDTTTGEAVDLVQELSFSDDLDKALESHASKQVYWECVAAEVSKSAQEFEQVGYAQWFAHSRHYAKLAIKGIGDDKKPTIADISDMVIRIFGKRARLEDKETYARYAFFAELCLERSGAKNAEAFRKSDAYPIKFVEFKERMFSYLAADPPWTYERVTLTLYNLKEQAEKLRAVARAFDKRSYSMKEFTDLEKAKFGNIGPLSVQEIVEEVSDRVRKELTQTSVDERSLMDSVSRSRRR